MAAIVSVPTIVMASVVLVVGVAGNAVVCYVCGRRLAGRSVLNNFVLALAVLDLVGCGLCLPLELVQLSIDGRSSPSTTAALCLSHRFLRYLLLVSSLFLLLAIATERYRRICRPQTRPLDLPRCRLVIVASVIVAVFLSWPSLFIFGQDHDHPHHHHQPAGGSGRSRGPEGRGGRSAELTVGPEAAVDREPVSLGVCHVKPSMRGSVYPVIYFSGLFVVFFLACLLLATLYARIAFAIWRPRKLRTDARARSASLPDCRRLNAAPPFPVALLGRDVLKALPSPAGAGGAVAAALEGVAPPSGRATAVVGSSSTLGRSFRLLGRNVLNFGHIVSKPSSFYRQDIGDGVVRGDVPSPVRGVGEEDATGLRRVEASPEDSSSETRGSPTELTAMLDEDAAGDVAVPTVAGDKDEVTEAEALDRVTTDRSPPHVVQGVMTVGRCGLLLKKDFYKLGTWRRQRVPQRDPPFTFPAAPTVQGPDATASAAVPAAMYDELTRSLHFRRKREAVSKLLLLSPTSSYRRQRRAAYSRTRTTLIMFLMTLVSIISYLPYVIISAIFTSASDFYVSGPASWELGSLEVAPASSSLLGQDRGASSAFPTTAAARQGQKEEEGGNGGVGRLTLASAMVLTLCLKSYLISGALNPVIYGFCNRRFKAECRRIWRSLVARWHGWLPGHCWGGGGDGQRESRPAGKGEEAARTAAGRPGMAVAAAVANAAAVAAVARTASKDRLEESSETSPSDL